MSSERERITGEGSPGESGQDRREERLRALYTEAYLPLDPSEALERRVAAVMARHVPEPAARRPARLAWWPLRPIGWGPAAGALAAALLLAALGLTLVWREHGRSPGQHRPTVVN